MDFKFSIRQLMIATFVFSFFACCMAAAARGNITGFSIVWGFVLAIVPIAGLVVVYLLATLLLRMFGSYDATPPGLLPPGLLPPEPMPAELMPGHSPVGVEDQPASQTVREEETSE